MKLHLLLASILGLATVAPGVLVSAQQAESPEQVVAIVDGRKITLAEVDSKAGMRLQQLRVQVYQQRLAALDLLIRELLLEREAEKQGVSLAEYKRLLILEARVSETEVDDIIRKLYPPEAINNPIIREQIRVRLERSKKEEVLRSKAGEIRKGAEVEVFLSAPAPPSVDVATGGRESLGNPSAPVTVIEFGDFQCEHCRAAVPVVKEVLSLYGDKVRYVYRHFPLNHHQYARMAAEAAECARAEGKFWEYHDLLFEKASSFSLRHFVELAASLNLDTGPFERCLITGRYRPILEEDIEEGQRVGISATPTFFVNGRRFSGTPRVADLQRLIEEELKNLEKEPGR